jgi:signal transduction histidine kinase
MSRLFRFDRTKIKCRWLVLGYLASLGGITGVTNIHWNQLSYQETQLSQLYVKSHELEDAITKLHLDEADVLYLKDEDYWRHFQDKQSHVHLLMQSLQQQGTTTAAHKADSRFDTALFKRLESQLTHYTTSRTRIAQMHADMLWFKPHSLINTQMQRKFQLQEALFAMNQPSWVGAFQDLQSDQEIFFETQNIAVVDEFVQDVDQLKRSIESYPALTVSTRKQLKQKAVLYQQSTTQLMQQFVAANLQQIESDVIYRRLTSGLNRLQKELQRESQQITAYAKVLEVIVTCLNLIFFGSLSATGWGWKLYRQTKHDRYLQERSYQAQMRQLQQTLDLAEIEHETKTLQIVTLNQALQEPVNNLLSHTQQLAKSSVFSSEQIHHLSGIFHNSELLLHLLKTFNSMPLAEAISSPHLNISVNLFELVHRVLERIQDKAQRQHVVLTCHFPETLPPTLSVDGGNLQHLLLTLLNTVLECTQQGEIFLSATLEANISSMDGHGLKAIDHLSQPLEATVCTSCQPGLITLALDIKTNVWQVDNLRSQWAASLALGHQMGGQLMLQPHSTQGYQITIVLPVSLKNCDCLEASVSKDLEALHTQLSAMAPAFFHMSNNWLQLFYDAAVQGNDQALLNLIMVLPGQYQSLQLPLQHLIDEFAFETLANLAEKALQEQQVHHISPVSCAIPSPT